MRTERSVCVSDYVTYKFQMQCKYNVKNNIYIIMYKCHAIYKDILNTLRIRIEGEGEMRSLAVAHCIR